jgi:hypothetical protein
MSLTAAQTHTPLQRKGRSDPYIQQPSWKMMAGAGTHRCKAAASSRRWRHRSSAGDGVGVDAASHRQSLEAREGKRPWVWSAGEARSLRRKKQPRRPTSEIKARSFHRFSPGEHVDEVGRLLGRKARAPTSFERQVHCPLAPDSLFANNIFIILKQQRARDRRRRLRLPPKRG